MNFYHFTLTPRSECDMRIWWLVLTSQNATDIVRAGLTVDPRDLWLYPDKEYGWNKVDLVFADENCFALCKHYCTRFNEAMYAANEVRTRDGSHIWKSRIRRATHGY